MVITIIHGTWALDNNWTKKSVLVKKIKEEFPNVTINRFPWTGKNSHFYRDDATFRLIEKIKEVKDPVHFLIAHSHGGNIALNSLADPDIELRGIITLNTPFLYVLEKNIFWSTDRILKDFGILSIIIGLYLSYMKVNGLYTSNNHYIVSFILTLLGVLIFWKSETIINFFKVRFFKSNSLVEDINCQRNLTCPVVSYVSGNDEAIDTLQLLDSVSNIPSILMTKLTRKVVLIVSLAIFVGKCLFYNILYQQKDAADCIGKGLLYVFIAVLGCYIVIFLTSLITSYLFRAYGLGINSFSFSDMMSRIVVTPVPVNYNKHSLEQVILPLSSKSLTYHSALYDDIETSKRITEWINKGRRRRVPTSN